MLQKVPLLVNEEFRQGNIKQKKAIFTIGMFHIHEIIAFLNEKAIKIHTPLPASTGKEEILAGLNLLKENFGVSVILPRMLAQDRKILEMNELYEVVRKCQDSPLPQNP
jgi:hypothetical protein